MATQQFATAGQQLGLHVWRVENMKLVPISKDQHGNFNTGDSYLLLNTMSISPPVYNTHTWIGNDSSQDERGAAAILMVQLDDCLKGAPVQMTEFQDNESLTFMSYFKSGIKYKNGGVASGFKHVVINEDTNQRLLHVKGRHVIRAMDVEMSWGSFNKGDCFLIELGENLYPWSGSESKAFERFKTTELAIDIRDNEQAGRGEIHLVDEGSEPEEILKVLGHKPDLPSRSEDKLTDAKNKNIASLYLISNASGSMKITKKADKNPFKQSDLLQNECYILDNVGNRTIFVWKGKDANAEERKEAISTAQQFIKDRCYPQKTQLQVIPAGSETTLFKQFFKNWLDKDETTGPCLPYSLSRIASVEQIPFDAATLHSNNTMAAQHGMVDDGSGKVQIWRVEDVDKVPVNPSTYGQFFGGDCYIILYTYNDGAKEKYIIYIWQGQKCSKHELGASAILAINLDDSMGGAATQVRVTQGQEPPHLVSLFKEKPLVVYLGGTNRDHGESKPGSTRLFHIRQSSTKVSRAVEVEPVASCLNTNDMFVLKSQHSLWSWRGKGATTEELDVANYVVKLLGGCATEVEEASEPSAFWEALGGEGPYQASISLQLTVKLPRLFVCSNKTGRLVVDEVPGELIQIQLATDDVMILDTWYQIFVWIGRDANETEKTGFSKIAQDYVNSDPSGRKDVPICIIKQGQEPPSFTGWFHTWDPNMWDKSPLV